jgi:hypothetical protein
MTMRECETHAKERIGALQTPKGLVLRNASANYCGCRCGQMHRGCLCDEGLAAMEDRSPVPVRSNFRSDLHEDIFNMRQK